MKKKEDKSLSQVLVNTNRERFHDIKIIVILSVVTVIVCALTIWNATGLRAAIDRRTLNYVSDVSVQLSDDVDNRLKKVTSDLALLGDSLIQIKNYESTDSLKDFLNRKAEILGFTAIVVCDLNGNSYSTVPLNNDIFDLYGVKKSFKGENGVSFLDEQSILYSIPIYKESEIVGVLAGVRNKENMQQLIQPKSFSGMGLTCITNTNGQVIISPTDIDSFMQLEDIFMKEKDKQIVQDIHQMQSNMKNHIRGLLLFTAVDESKLVLAYEPLSSYDWVLLTLVPTDLISHETDQYITQSFLIIAGVILLFILLLVMFLKIYKGHYQRLESFAFTDPVTNWVNNAAFQLKLLQLLPQSPPLTYTMISLNVKNFKLINESFGSEEGNKTLRYIMKIINRHRMKDEAAARAEADNFFFFMKENDPEIIRNRLKIMIDDINTFQKSIKDPYSLIIQQGAYIIDQPTLDITVIQDRAKTACRNRLSHEDGVCIFYDSKQTDQLKKEHELNELFESSLHDKDFQVYLQPKISLADNQVAGAEALIRWKHPQRGMMSPAEFVPLFEKNGKICKLDLYVFEEVCKLLQRWMQSGKKVFPISVNFSRHHFQMKDPLAQYKEIADRYQIPKGFIEIELTESIFLTDQGIQLVKDQIHNMHQMGFLCSLDDFGAGFSALGLLIEFDIDIIKLDRRFSMSLDRPKTRDVVESIIQLSKKIKTQTVAEGIETPEQLHLLREIHCDMVQGYVFSKPLPIPEFEAWMENRKLK